MYAIVESRILASSSRTWIRADNRSSSANPTLGSCSTLRVSSVPERTASSISCSNPSIKLLSTAVASAPDRSAVNVFGAVPVVVGDTAGLTRTSLALFVKCAYASAVIDL